MMPLKDHIRRSSIANKEEDCEVTTAEGAVASFLGLSIACFGTL